ncbi:ribbon-helix-helix protein, CopG family [Candidatus Acetothermia bacterium]|jgi:predicted transcriptional regulator|nr:ribbon-helix-helix protein, CopG family [Candidatus Acetothermia bacterium]MCI2431939.1 ribbon-helix-helix protein, CopG family [Candidatus Acetothermia bacterium]MCI2436620.1 ribbon-helix-helix protein, CopG family [Candidatus Acetothermia bacterium]
MKTRVTLTLDPHSVRFLDELARRRRLSRSAALEHILQEHMRCCEEEELANLAEKFFAEPEMPTEADERRAWQKLSTEVLARGSD